MLTIKNSKKYGRGVYATRTIKTGELIECSPVILLDDWEADRITPTVLNCYVFEYGVKTAIALGFGSLFNHSESENVTYRANFRNKTIEYAALCEIKKGQQLFVNYGYDVLDGIEVTKDNRIKAEWMKK